MKLLKLIAPAMIALLIGCAADNEVQDVSSNGRLGTDIYGWVASDYGACSATCGSGTQSRNVNCVSSSGTTVADSFCTAAKPVLSQACSALQCSWKLQAPRSGEILPKCNPMPVLNGACNNPGYQCSAFSPQDSYICN